MREIKFRGIPLFGEKFIFGSLIIEPNERGEVAYTIRRYENGSVSYFEAKKESVGQYTGLKDKNSVEIYEGDIIRYEFNKLNYRIEFVNAEFIARRFYQNIENLYPAEFNYGKECEVIGNAYENPELLE